VNNCERRHSHQCFQRRNHSEGGSYPISLFLCRWQTL